MAQLQPLKSVNQFKSDLDSHICAVLNTEVQWQLFYHLLDFKIIIAEANFLWHTLSTLKLVLILYKLFWQVIKSFSIPMPSEMHKPLLTCYAVPKCQQISSSFFCTYYCVQWLVLLKALTLLDSRVVEEPRWAVVTAGFRLTIKFCYNSIYRHKPCSDDSNC